MSQTAPTLAAPAAAPAAPARGARPLLACAALACALVLASGAARLWQARRVAATLEEGRTSKFPLAELPMTLGDWVGERTELDPTIVARTGSNDLITRRYVNRTTGVTIDLIAMHGPAHDVFIHTPELCYPLAGYRSSGDAAERKIPIEGGSAPFRSLAFAKGDAARPDSQEVVFSWRYNGHWTTRVDRPKEMERVPGMYKVQVSRRLEPGESRSVANPCEAFLELFVPAFEARLRGQPAPSPDAQAGPSGAPAAHRDPTHPEGTQR